MHNANNPYNAECTASTQSHALYKQLHKQNQPHSNSLRVSLSHRSPRAAPPVSLALGSQQLRYHDKVAVIFEQKALQSMK